MDPIKQKIIRTAVASRVFIWTLSVISDNLVPNHDAGVFLWTSTPKAQPVTYCDKFFSLITDGLTNWDGQYFLHIANNGYTYENTLAFFPGYPFLVRIAGEILHWLQVEYGFISLITALKLSAILVNIALFTCAALALYDLSWRIFRDEYLAYKSVLYFCINPASIFFSATYSESYHAATTFFVMTFLDRGFSFKVGLLLALCGFGRSNAFLNIGFVFYKCAKRISLEFYHYKKLEKEKKHETSSLIANIIGDALFPAFFCTLTALAPFVLFQWYGYTLYCSLTKMNLHYDQEVIDYAGNHSLKLPSAEPSDWCFYTIPMAYQYIQSHYWNVGFLKYFHWKQIPNFILASPLIFFILERTLKFLKHHKEYSICLGLNFKAFERASNYNTYGLRILPKESFIYIAHAAFLATFAFFCIHVQVATRMLASSTPVIYWWMALLTTPNDRKPMHQSDSKYPRLEVLQKLETKENMASIWKNLVFDEVKLIPKEWRILFNYCCIYACLGTVLFANFLPWT